jgi:hypothetical protein
MQEKRTSMEQQAALLMRNGASYDRGVTENRSVQINDL